MAAPDKHIDGARTRLGHLAGLGEKTAAAERKILEAATERAATLAADLDKLRPRVDLDPDAADRYMALTQEAGQVALVIARARQAIAA